MKMKAHRAAVEILRETDNPWVMAGDLKLLHAIAERAGLGVRGGRHTPPAVLDALSRDPGPLIPDHVRRGDGRRVRRFRLRPAP